MRNKVAILGTLAGGLILGYSLIKSSIDDKLLTIPQTKEVKKEYVCKSKQNMFLAYSGILTIILSLRKYEQKEEFDQYKKEIKNESNLQKNNYKL